MYSFIKTFIKKNFVHIQKIRFRKNIVNLGISNSISISGINNIIKGDKTFCSNIKIVGNDNHVIIGENTTLNNCKISIQGSNTILHIGNNNSISNSFFIIQDNNAKIVLGNNGYIGGARLFSIGENNTIEIGDNFLFSDNIDLWNNDGHSIIDCDTGYILNNEKPITIEDNVWIGTGSIILKGVTISSNSIIAAKSVVNKNVKQNTIVAGNPAKKVKENIYWKFEK